LKILFGESGLINLSGTARFAAYSNGYYLLTFSSYFTKMITNTSNISLCFCPVKNLAFHLFFSDSTVVP